MSAESFRSALAAAGIAAAVEERERLAVITARDAFASRAIVVERERVVSMAKTHGFSHVALELAPPRRPESVPGSDAAFHRD